ncbi:hypothetical protein IWZ03DRAFT_233479 [Phyllosticta citriasiana]|uniref:Uncharacterized protein n=1 Tax=Phyllosticta citriasiana TaxID=595635 RepID=A0ABR1KMV7_9PEZI
MQMLSTGQLNLPKHQKTNPDNSRKCCCQRDRQEPNPTQSELQTRPDGARTPNARGAMGWRCPRLSRERTEARLVAVAQLPPRLAQQNAATLPEEDVAGKGIDEAGRNQRVLNVCTWSQSVHHSPSSPSRPARGKGRMGQGANKPTEAVWTRGRSTLTCRHSAQNSSASWPMKRKSSSSVTRSKRGARPKWYLTIMAVTLAFHSSESDRIPSTAQATWCSTSQLMYLGL